MGGKKSGLKWALVSSGDDKAQFYTLRTAKALAMTALDVLMRPELLQKVKQEFSEAKLKEDKLLPPPHWADGSLTAHLTQDHQCLV